MLRLTIMNNELAVLHVRNKHGIRVARCCMSCAYKECTERMRLRLCTLDNMMHRRHHVCKEWKMNRTLERAGGR